MKKWLIGVIAVLFLMAANPASAQDKVKEDSQWAPTASFMAGKFDTNQVSDWTEQALDGLILDMTGRTWDIGAARGRAGHSYLRITFAQMKIDDGSSAYDGSTRYETRSMTIKGLRVERQFRIGPAKWVVAPMLTISGGAGKISGSTVKHDFMWVYDPQIRGLKEVAKPPVEETAKELFDGHEWLPMLGLSAGLTASPVKHLTVTVGVYGLEFPGTYKGMVQVVYWPR